MVAEVDDRGVNSTRGGIRVGIETLNIRGSECGRASVDVHEGNVSLAQGWSWNRAYNTLRFPLAGAFVIAKEEEAIINDRAAKRCSKNVSEKFQWLVRLPTRQFCLLNEIVVGAGDGVAHVFIRRAVEVVCAAFGYESNLSARTGTLIRVVVGGSHAEFLDGVQCHREHGSESGAASLVVYVSAVESNVALV